MHPESMVDKHIAYFDVIFRNGYSCRINANRLAQLAAQFCTLSGVQIQSVADLKRPLAP